MLQQQQHQHLSRTERYHRQETNCRAPSAAIRHLDRPAKTGISCGDPVRHRRTSNQKPCRLKESYPQRYTDTDVHIKDIEGGTLEMSLGEEYLLISEPRIKDNKDSLTSREVSNGRLCHSAMDSNVSSSNCKGLVSSCRDFVMECRSRWRTNESWDRLWKFIDGHNDGSAKAMRRGGLRRLLHAILFTMTLLAITQAYTTDAVRYDTAYACEGKTLKIECRDGEVIHLIRANYGRFSITICNDHGNTDWSVNCMSTKSLRVLHTRCSSNQNCSILASTSMFGDPCPNTLKYLEAHYTCTQATTTSSTFRPSPPWLTTSQPSVWRSTTPATSLSSGVGGANAGTGVGAAGAARPAPGNSASGGAHHLAPPTFRPHITMPPDLRPGVIKGKNDGHSSDSGSKPSVKLPPEVIIPSTLDGVIIEPDVTEQLPPKTKDIDDREGYTESLPKKNEDTIRDREFSGNIGNSNTNVGNSKNGSNSKIPSGAIPSSIDREQHTPVGDGDASWRHRHHPHHENVDLTGAGLPSWRHCSPIVARGLQWNWTLVGEVAVQPCPGGATGLARWRCVSTAHRLSHLQQQKRLGAPSRETLSTHHSQSRPSVHIDDFGSETLLTGRNVEQNQELSDFLDNAETLMLPDPLASSGHSDGTLRMQKPYDGDNLGKAVWISESPDLSECRSVWLNSLETRVREGESLLSISNDLSQVTSSKTLYGGDMMTTTNIMKRLAQRMSQNIQSFPDTRQREAIVTDLLLGVVKTGSNLLDASQQASWKDLSHSAQMRVATSLLIGLEENAFLLAEAVLREKTIVQQVKNILLSVRVLETRNVETEEFPSVIAKGQWTPSQDTIYLPRGALIDNSEGGLVRIVFVAFDRLEEILQPPAAPPYSSLQPLHTSEEDALLQQLLASREGDGTVDPLSASPSDHQQINKDKDNVTRVINSKVISASLGKGRHIQLSQPVRLTLRHLRTENVTNPTCVFWDYTVNVWSAEGCRVEWTNATHTGCQCVHLTNFALLMDVRAVPLQQSHRLALHLLTIIGCSLSALALFAAIIIFHCFRGMKSDRITIHKNLCFCLLVAELIFMFGIERTANRVVCGVIAAFLHYFFLAAFAWMFLEGFQLYAMLVEVFEPERARARWYYPAAYIIPLIIVSISGIVDSSSYGTDRHCWLRSDNYFILWFVVPVALVLLANWICLSMVIYIMCHHSNVSIKAKENNKLYKIRIWLRSSIFLAVVLGLTWTFGLLYLSEETVVFAYLFTGFNSLQGLFIFIFHILLNENFQKECGRLGRRHRWLSCCARFAPAPTPAPATGSGSSPAPVIQSGTLPSGQSLAGGMGVLGPQGAGTKGRNSQRQHQQEDLRLDDQVEGHGQSTSSKHQPSNLSGTLQHEHSRRMDTRTQPRHHNTDSLRMSHQRQHYHPHSHHTYSEIGRIGYRRGSENEFRDIHDDPVYEEIERNETLMSDMSDDNSGNGDGFIRQIDPHGHPKFYGDHRPLISYSPGDNRHRYDRSPVALDHQIPHGKFNTGRWGDSLNRHPDERMMYGFHPQDANMRTLAAVLKADNDVASKVLCHGPHQRVLPPYSDC